jgi:hypothetical protein
MSKCSPWTETLPPTISIPRVSPSVVWGCVDSHEWIFGLPPKAAHPPALPLCSARLAGVPP